MSIGLEFNDLAISKCIEKGYDVRKEPIETFAESHANEFDSVVLFQVLEHIYNVRPFIEALIKAAKVGGEIIIAVPDNSPYHRNFRKYSTMNLPPHHMGLWNATSFENLESQFPIELVDISYVGPTDILNYIYYLGDLILSGSPIYKSPALKFLSMLFLLPYTVPKVVLMKIKKELRPHCIVATFRKLPT